MNQHESQQLCDIFILLNIYFPSPKKLTDDLSKNEIILAKQRKVKHVSMKIFLRFGIFQKYDKDFSNNSPGTCNFALKTR